MVENLKTTRYNDGTTIPNVTDNTIWSGLTTGALCYYNNDANYNSTYGKLYNWHAVNTGKLAPAGWHIPTDAEWETLTTFLGGASISGDKMKATTLWTSNTGNSNSSGFTGLPAGSRLDVTTGNFKSIGARGYFWSSNESNTYNAWQRGLSSNYSDASRASSNKVYGISVRCIKD